MQNTELRRDVLRLQRITAHYDGPLTGAIIDMSLDRQQFQWLSPLPYLFISEQGMEELMAEVTRYMDRERAASMKQYRGIWVAVLPTIPAGTLVFNDFTVDP